MICIVRVVQMIATIQVAKSYIQVIYAISMDSGSLLYHLSESFWFQHNSNHILFTFPVVKVEIPADNCVFFIINKHLKWIAEIL